MWDATAARAKRWLPVRWQNRSGVGFKRGFVAISGGLCALALVGASAIQAGPARAAANTACPSGYETITVADAVAQGYRVTSVQADVNGDGVVCRRLLGDGTLNRLPDATVPHIYIWQDNATPR
jgi:hypothetical protein